MAFNKQLVTDFFTQLVGFEPEILIDEQPEEVLIHISLDPQLSGMFIGYRGEVLTSMQLLLSLMLQEDQDTWIPIRVNINDYREQRVKALEDLALNTASKAMAVGLPVPLHNLTSYERRIIHSTLSGHPDVETYSEGENPYRVLVVTPRNV